MASGDASSNSQDSLDESLKLAKKAAAECILSSSWTFTIPSVILSVPMSVYLKTYSPLVFAACSASGLDFFRGLQKCKDLTDQVKRIQLKLALLNTDAPRPEM